MNVSASRLAMSGSTTNASSYKTASITPSANKPVIIFVLGKGSKEATVSGCNLTFTKKKFVPNARFVGTLTVLEGLGASPTPGQLTIYFGGETQEAAEWIVVELTNTDTSSGSSVRQVSGGSAPGDVSSYTCPALLSFGGTSNATIGCFSNESGSGVGLNPGSGFTELGETGFYESNNSMFEFRSTPDTTVNASRTSGTGAISGVALEIIALTTSASPSISPSLSSSVSPSLSPSLSPSVSPSASVSPSVSVSPSFSPSVSPSVSVSPSFSPSISPSFSPSFSPSVSPSISLSPLVSPSPSLGWYSYTKGDYVLLPANNNALETSYTAGDYANVQSYNGVTVDQSAELQYAIHQFKDYIEDLAQEVTVTLKTQSNTNCYASPVVLQVYNINTSSWENLDSDSAAEADTDFTLTATISDLTNYLAGDRTVSCRVYQLGV